MNLKQFETFLCLATLGNFRKTAEFLHTSQPAVSARIATLEQEVGEKLFDRGTAHVSLTPKGHELVPYAEKVVASVEAFRVKSGSPGEMTGVLRLGVVETIVQTWLPNFLQSIDQQCPGLDVEITVDVTENLRNGLVERSLDLALVQGPISVVDMENIHLATYDLVWVVSPKLGFKSNDHLSTEDLAKHRIITHARNTTTYIEVYRHFRADGEQPIRIVPSSSLAACMSMAVGKIGIGTIPKPVVEDQIQAGNLVELRHDWTPSPLTFTAAFPLDPFHPASELAAQIAQEVAK